VYHLDLTSRAREEVDFQGIRFLTGAARIVLMAVIDLNCPNSLHMNEKC
jgi:hypothetical protein